MYSNDQKMVKVVDKYNELFLIYLAGPD